MEVEEEEEEARAELEAAMAVYGDDCAVIRVFPLHINVRLRPRTADESSKQFVEAVLGLKAGPQYPKEPPNVDLVDSMGLDAERCEKLVALLQNRGLELSSRPMMISLCEEAVDILSDMNHPEGNCPLCLDPLFQRDSNEKPSPFMKLMSCFHCFHCDCILRWWNWVQQERQTTSKYPLQRIGSLFEDQRDMKINLEQHQANCPVCRKVFALADLEHILEMVEANMSEPVRQSIQRCSEADEESPEFNLMNSESEIRRRERFESFLKIQRLNDGLIEPKKDLIVTPGMFLPEQLAPVDDGGGQVGVRIGSGRGQDNGCIVMVTAASATVSGDGVGTCNSSGGDRGGSRIGHVGNGRVSGVSSSSGGGSGSRISEVRGNGSSVSGLGGKGGEDSRIGGVSGNDTRVSGRGVWGSRPSDVSSKVRRGGGRSGRGGGVGGGSNAVFGGHGSGSGGNVIQSAVADDETSKQPARQIAGRRSGGGRSSGRQWVKKEIERES